MRKLTDAVQGYDNNLNLLRIVAAFAVLVSHSFALAVGSPAAEPLRNWLGFSLGEIAVDVFFLVSGFLVTNSFLKRQCITSFLVSRGLRIFPGLLCAMVLSVLVMGPLLTSLPLFDYFARGQTWIYFLKCSTLVAGVTYALPGVFETNPIPQAVNGSLWTLPWEIRMYLLIPLCWVAVNLLRRPRMRSFKLCAAGAAIASGVLLLSNHLNGTELSHGLRLLFAFSTGASYASFANRVRLSSRLFCTVCALLVASSLAGQNYFYPAYLFCMGYAVLCAAYLPGGTMRAYNRLGDYSYGVYIYSFPIQQCVVMLNPGISPWAVAFWSGLGTLCAAVLSWHLVERPAMRLRDRLITRQQASLALKGA
jgi:peptidoglycan/LPS O-acetylase OafA/YrhL